MSTLPRHFIPLLTLALILSFAAISYSWTYTPHGRLDYRAALSLKLLSFDRTIQPDPAVDFELTVPVNLLYALSFALPKEELQEITDIVIPGLETEIPARVYRPMSTVNSVSPAPVIVFFHGGGFVVGSIDIFDSLTRALANATSAIVVSVGYRLAPAHPYPAAIEDAYTALQWVAKNIEDLGGDSARLVVAGESAGGNLAAVVALKARNEGGPRIAGQILYYPATDLTDTQYLSRDKFSDGYGLSTEAAHSFHEAYVGHIEDKSDPYVSPVYAPSLANMPPTLMVTAGFDRLLDSCRAFAKRLQQAGTPVTYANYPGMIHGFMNIGVFPAKREALVETAAFLHDLPPTTSALATGVPQDLPRSDKPFANRPGNFQFVIVGDRTGGHRPGVFRHAIERINQLQPEFVVGVGDLIEGYKEDQQELNREWDELDSIVNALEMPFYYTVGNHDIGNNVMRELWLQRNGPDYYSFVYQDVLFISLNTEDPPIILPEETLARQAWLEEMMLKDPDKIRQLLRERRNSTAAGSEKPKLPGEVAISNEQVEWLDQVLKSHPDVRWTILLMHKPAWSYVNPVFERIEALLQDRPYTMIAGHEHYFNYSQRRDRDYITMATTGGIWLTEGGGSFDHIAWVTMTDEGPLISNIALCGMLGTPQETLEAMSADSADEYCFRSGE